MNNADKKHLKIEIAQLDEKQFGNIPAVYAAAFDDEPWVNDWHNIPQFDKKS